MTPTAAQPLQVSSLSDEEVELLDSYWRAANYLSVGQIYLLDNALLRRKLKQSDTKPRLLGHWGTSPGLNFMYVHLNRVIRSLDLNAIFICGPGHGGPAMVANAYLEGTYSEVYPNIKESEEGMRHLFRQFSFPGGIPSHASPDTPGSIHEGGELGYSLSHAYGAAFDNPNLIVFCAVGDGEAETGPLATGWHSNKFLNAAKDGAVIPILHLNGFKIASPTILARIGYDELESLLTGYGYEPIFVEGHEPHLMHQKMAAAVDLVLAKVKEIQRKAREEGDASRPHWPMIVLKSPKGWTGPAFVDGKKTEGNWRSHQVPIPDMKTQEHLDLLESWMQSYRPSELFDESGQLNSRLRELPPKGDKRMSANPHANGGLLLRDLSLRNFSDFAVQVDSPGTTMGEATRVAGAFLRSVMADNSGSFRLMGPDETASNRLEAVFEATGRTWEAETEPDDDAHLQIDGHVMEMLSEHNCQGWIEGYLLTGRHGLFSCYEAFIHIIDSMFNQHAKWLKASSEIPWRRPIASLNYLLTSHVWRQDHNGFTHQDPGFIDHVVNKKASIVRVYLPPDANTLLSTVDHCLRSRNYVNVIVAGKQPSLQYLNIDAARTHCAEGLGIWEWASNDEGLEPDVVIACAGDVPTLEALAATSILRIGLPELRVRFVNVVDLMRLQPATEHPHGLSDNDFDSLFTKSKPIVFNFHGYPTLIHRLTYRRTGHENLHVRGYKEEGTTTTPFDMCVRNNIDRFNLAIDVIDRVPKLGDKGAHLKQNLKDRLLDHRQYILQHGEDPSEITDWKWPHEHPQP